LSVLIIPELKTTTLINERLTIEGLLAKNLNDTLIVIRRSKSDDLTSLINTFREIIFNFFRKFLESIYLVGINYVANRFRTVTHLNTEDLSFLDNKSIEYTTKFFGRLRNTMMETQKETFNNIVFINSTKINPLSTYNKNYMVNAVSITAVTDVLNHAITTRSQQLLTNFQLSEQFSSVKSIEEQLYKEGFFTKGKGLYQLQLKYTATPDEKTCLKLPNGKRGCALLDGTYYNITDRNKPDIPYETHPHCRCYYLLHERYVKKIL
jgi:hypothetical protein